MKLIMSVSLYLFLYLRMRVFLFVFLFVRLILNVCVCVCLCVDLFVFLCGQQQLPPLARVESQRTTHNKNNSSERCLVPMIDNACNFQNIMV